MPVNPYSLIVPVTYLLSSLPALAADSITAWLRDGRQVNGQVDASTNTDRLWIRQEAAGLVIVSGFKWEHIAEVRDAERTLQQAELQDMAATDRPRQRLRHNPSASTIRTSTGNTGQPHLDLATRRVKTLVVHAFLAQWDDDAHSDGIRVQVSPLDANGQLVPVEGQIELQLIVQNRDPAAMQGISTNHGYGELDRVSHMVRREHFKHGPASYDLPFGNQHPDFETNLAPHALVHARLGVPGVGVFEASDAQLWIRELSFFRDDLQLYYPHRYLPLEGHRHR
jgi:hypothetical protein